MTFHLYGLIIGLSISTAIYLIELKVKKYHLDFNQLWQMMGWVILGGVIGARSYHVITDWQLYLVQPLNIFKIWQGGLGIVGAIFGGGLALACYFYLTKKDFAKLLIWLDMMVFGLPFAQALGRWGNYVNQELFGLPTTLPWGIFIRLENRPSVYRSFSKFHPLFFYESLLMSIFGLIIWWLDQKKRITLGKGQLFLSYLNYYLVIRIFLDFFRIDRKVIAWGFDSNQLFFLGTVISVNFFYNLSKHDSQLQ